jgi:hypothetical protein
VSPDIFSAQSTETPWEWAKARRQWFKTPAKDLIGGAFLAVPGLVVRFSAGNPNWVRATVEAVGTALLGAVVLPNLEALYWLSRRRDILLDEREKSLAEREASVAKAISPPGPVVDLEGLRKRLGDLRLRYIELERAFFGAGRAAATLARADAVAQRGAEDNRSRARARLLGAVQGCEAGAAGRAGELPVRRRGAVEPALHGPWSVGMD